MGCCGEWAPLSVSDAPRSSRSSSRAPWVAPVLVICMGTVTSRGDSGFLSLFPVLYKVFQKDALNWKSLCLCSPRTRNSHRWKGQGVDFPVAATRCLCQRADSAGRCGAVTCRGRGALASGTNRARERAVPGRARARGPRAPEEKVGRIQESSLHGPCASIRPASPVHLSETL